VTRKGVINRLDKVMVWNTRTGRTIKAGDGTVAFVPFAKVAAAVS
jgi:hypothetical protein